MPVKGEFKTSLSEYDALAYHTALVDLENMLLGVSGKDDLSAILSTFQNSIVVHNEALKEYINKNINKFKEGIKKYQGEYDNYTFADWIIAGIRKERKRYDKIYFSSLLRREKPDIDQAKEFMETIKESDPAYYNNAYAILLECFKDFSSDVFKDSIISREERIETVWHAGEIVSSLNDDFRVLVVNEKEKPYEFREMDRMLFDGMISYELLNGKPVTLARAKEIAPLPASECLEHMESKYADSKNARVLIDVFRYVMQENKMEDVPLPLLINKVCEELEEEVAINRCREFFTLFHDEDGKAKKDLNNRLMWVEPLQIYCADHGIPYPKDGMDRGLKYTYRKSMENDSDNKQAFCEAMEAYLVDFCDRNSDYFDARVITAALGDKKFYPQSEQDLFSFLTKDSITSEDGEKLGPLFLKELHHDRERIGFSSAPNDSMENFILTFAVNSRIGEKGIYDYCVRLLKGKGDLTREQADDLMQRADSFEGSDFNIHDQILHGADAQMRYFDGKDNYTVMYYLTPVRPKERDKKSKDNYVLAMVDTSGIVYDHTKYRYKSRSREQIMSDIVQLRNVGHA